jgi:hypothetical protein
MCLSLNNNIIQLRFTSENQAAISSFVQDFGRLMDITREQQQQPTPQSFGNQARFPSSGHPHAAAHYVTTVPNSMYIQEQSQDDSCKSIGIKIITH